MQYSIEPNPRITFGVAYEDEHVVVVEKPARVATQPGKGHLTDTLHNGLFARYGAAMQKLGKVRDFGLLHRLDKDTSGLLIVALSAPAYDKLRDDFAKRRIKKFYWAICAGEPRDVEGVIKLGIVEDPVSVTTRASKPRRAHVSKSASAKPAVTAYRVVSKSEHACLIEARPVTGRLHQVRVHLEAIGCPILGDDFYGPRRVQGAANRLALHAHRLVFTHPVSGAVVDVEAGMPREMRKVMKGMRLAMPGKEGVGAGRDAESREE